MKVLLFLMLSLVVASAAPKETPLNVLFISVDDMNNDLSCYGQPLVQSPHIDKLAARGVRFDRAYCQFPLCSPSRSSVMTGLRPDTLRVYDLKKHFREEKPQVVTLPQYFKQKGYYVARVGKIYHYGNPGQIGTSGLDDPASWDEVYNPAGRDKTVLEPKIVNYTPKRGLGSAMSLLEDSQGSDEDHTDGMVASEGIKLLRQHQERPFFVALGFYKPHTPYVAPKKYFDLYPRDKIQLPAIIESRRSNLPEPALYSTRPWPWFGVTEEQAKECKRAYWATTSFVDAQIGRVLEELDRLRLREKTIVIFWSDHGYHLGEHGLWMKQSCFEESARVPLIISAPGVQPGVCTRTVELLDLYPTLIDLAGFKTQEALEGASLKPLLQNPAAEWNRPAFTQVRRGGVIGWSIRTERWRYTEWNRGEAGVELYDHQLDPTESTNLAFSSLYPEVKEQLQRALHGKFKVSPETDR